MRLVVLSMIYIALVSCQGASQELSSNPTTPEPSRQYYPQSNAEYSKDQLEYHLYSEHILSSPNGGQVIFQNSFPKGGSWLGEDGGIGYTKEEAGFYGYGVLFSRVENQTAQPITLDLHFSGDSLLMTDDPNEYLKLFLLPDTMHTSALAEFNFGITRAIDFLDHHFYLPTSLNRTIPPGESTMFNVLLLTHVTDNGRIRTEFVPHGTEMKYALDVAPFGKFEVDGGRITFEP